MTKKFQDLTPEETKDIKVEFAPGCFDNFEGTQEELDQIIADIERMAKSGELQARSEPFVVDIDSLDEEELAALAHKLLSSEEIQELVEQGMPSLAPKRNLQ